MHIAPFFCSNVEEFVEERQFLRNDIFPYLKTRLKENDTTFDPVQLDYNESHPYFKSGQLLRLLFRNIETSQPFFIGFIGLKYGLNRLSSQTIRFGQCLTSLEKNLIIASQSGYSNIVNSATCSNSFLEHQINFACSSHHDTSLFRFYFRQYEYLEEKFGDLSLDKRKEEINCMDVEDEWAKEKLDKLKAFLVKQGIKIRYYKSIQQFKQLFLEDFEEIINGIKYIF